MIEGCFARLRTHRNNVQRYRQLLATRLTDLERQFIQKRLSEEQSAIEILSAETFPSSSRTQCHLRIRTQPNTAQGRGWLMGEKHQRIRRHAVTHRSVFG